MQKQSDSVSPVSFSQSVEIKLKVVPDLSDWVNENILAGGEDHLVTNGTEVVLDVVNLLLVPVDNLVSIEHHVPPEQSRQSGSKPETETTVEGLRSFFDVKTTK